MLLFNPMDIQYWFRRSKAQPERPAWASPHDFFCMIYIRIRVKKQRIDITTTSVECWRSEFKRGKVVCRDNDLERQGKSNSTIRAIIQKLETAKEALDKHYLAEGLDPLEITAHDIKKSYLRVLENKVAAGIAVPELIKKWYQQQVNRFESGEITNSTRSARLYYSLNLTSFFTEFKKENIQVRDLKESDVDDLKYFLLAKKRLRPAYVGKNIRCLKEIMIWAKRTGEIRSNPIKEYRVMGLKQEYDTTCLSEMEIKLLWNFDPDRLEQPISPTMARALVQERDSLLFTCVTGMHDGDYKAQHYSIQEDSHGIWLSGKRGKTGQKFKVPLDPIGISILKKYGSIDGLPVRSNKTRNENLKVLAVVAGIKTKLTTKIGRKTFADRMLNVLGYDPLDVAVMLGQRNTSHLKHYVRVRTERLARKFIPFDLSDNEEAA
jgi:site-specific recombinase XerD